GRRVEGWRPRARPHPSSNIQKWWVLSANTHHFWMFGAGVGPGEPGLGPGSGDRGSGLAIGDRERTMSEPWTLPGLDGVARGSVRRRHLRPALARNALDVAGQLPACPGRPRTLAGGGGGGRRCGGTGAGG